MISPPKKILIETCSICNRECPTCLRQNDPKQSRWFEGEKEDRSMPYNTVFKIINQAIEFGFKVPIGFVWFNEPLQDTRLVEFAEYAHDKGFYVYTTTNGDLLTDELAKELDAVLNHIDISIYRFQKQPDYDLQLMEYYKKLFQNTKVMFSWGGKQGHVVTHYSPDPRKNELIQKYNNNACYNPQSRLIITYSGDMALCCEDLACNWNLGNINDNNLKELWYSKRHQKIIEVLNMSGSRYAYEYCEYCPRDGSL